MYIDVCGLSFGQAVTAELQQKILELSRSEAAGATAATLAVAAEGSPAHPGVTAGTDHGGASTAAAAANVRDTSQHSHTISPTTLETPFTLSTHLGSLLPSPVPL